MKQAVLIIVIAFVCSSNLFSQATERKASFETVKIPDSIKVRLVDFLSAKEKNTITGAILIYNLIDKKNYKYKDGIYSFRLMGSHFVRQVFIVFKGELHIFNGYYFNELLPEFNEYIQKVELPTKSKIAYLKAVAVFLSEEYEIENS